MVSSTYGYLDTYGVYGLYINKHHRGGARKPSFFRSAASDHLWVTIEDCHTSGMSNLPPVSEDGFHRDYWKKSCKMTFAGWWLSPTPLKNDGVKVSWEYDFQLFMESHNPAMFQSPPKMT